MATITIPSPTALLDSPTPGVASTPKASAKATTKKRTPSTLKYRKSRSVEKNLSSKPRQTKSRDGCKNCKEKRLKCDERKPACEQCEKKGVICKGYEKVLKWRPQEDTFTTKTGPPQPRRNSTTVKTPRRTPASPSPTSPFPRQTNDALPDPLPHPSSFQQPPASLNICLHRRKSSLEGDVFAFEHAEDTQDQNHVQQIPLGARDSFASSTPSLLDGSFDEDDTPQSARTVESSLWLGDSPPMPSTLLSKRGFTVSHQAHVDGQPANAAVGHAPQGSPFLQAFPMYDEEEVEEIIREQDPAESWLVPIASPTSSDSSASSGGAWADAYAATVWGQPRMRYDSEETLMLRFDKQTCGILSVKDGPTENPWRTMLWPLAKEHGALRHAITSMTAFHASKESPQLRIKGMEHMTQSLQLLSHGIESMPLITSLATTLVLAFCESWDMLISTGIRHLRGASHLIAEIMTKYRREEIFPENEPHLGFLCRTWVYMDVISRLTSLEGDDSTNFDIVGTPLCQSSISHEMDPLMGCASTLFPMIGRVANLVREVRQRTQRNSFQIISQAKDLMSRLEKWNPPPLIAAPEDQCTEVEQGLWTAEAYRGASLLYLLQAVPEISYGPITEKIAALANGVLEQIANVPVTSGMIIIHIFPLLAAGCEAIDPENRAFVIERWEAMMQRMKIQNLDRCLDVVKEVWARRDDAVLNTRRQEARVTALSCSNGNLPTTRLKRKYSSGGEDDPMSPAEEMRRAIMSMSSPSPSTRKLGFFKQESTTSCNGLDFDLTVRGRQHWAGVMRDLSWEVLIG